MDLAMAFFYLFQSIVLRFVPLKYRAKDISGQIALVTGAGGGIGRLLCLGLASQGCKIVCWDVAKQGNNINFLNANNQIIVQMNTQPTKKRPVWFGWQRETSTLTTLT